MSRSGPLFPSGDPTASSRTSRPGPGSPSRQSLYPASSYGPPVSVQPIQQVQPFGYSPGPSYGPPGGGPLLLLGAPQATPLGAPTLLRPPHAPLGVPSHGPSGPPHGPHGPLHGLPHRPPHGPPYGSPLGPPHGAQHPGQPSHGAHHSVPPPHGAHHSVPPPHGAHYPRPPLGSPYTLPRSGDNGMLINQHEHQRSDPQIASPARAPLPSSLPSIPPKLQPRPHFQAQSPQPQPQQPQLPLEPTKPSVSTLPSSATFKKVDDNDQPIDESLTHKKQDPEKEKSLKTPEEERLERENKEKEEKAEAEIREQNRKTFKEMLRERGVKANDEWKNSLAKFISDPRYKLLKTVGEKKDLFEEYKSEAGHNEQAEKKAAEQRAKDDFIAMLDTCPQIHPDVRWRTVEDLLHNDPRWIAVKTQHEREDMFLRHLADLTRRDREQERGKKKAFATLLKEISGITWDSRWKDAEPLLQDQGAFHDCPRKFRMKAFTEHIRDLQETERLRREKLDREIKHGFFALLQEMVDALQFGPQASWVEVEEKLEAKLDERYLAVLRLVEEKFDRKFKDRIERAKRRAAEKERLSNPLAIPPPPPLPEGRLSRSKSKEKDTLDGASRQSRSKSKSRSRSREREKQREREKEREREREKELQRDKEEEEQEQGPGSLVVQRQIAQHDYASKLFTFFIEDLNDHLKEDRKKVRYLVEDLKLKVKNDDTVENLLEKFNSANFESKNLPLLLKELIDAAKDDETKKRDKKKKKKSKRKRQESSQSKSKSKSISRSRSKSNQNPNAESHQNEHTANSGSSLSTQTAGSDITGPQAQNEGNGDVSEDTRKRSRSGSKNEAKSKPKKSKKSRSRSKKKKKKSKHTKSSKD